MLGNINNKQCQKKEMKKRCTLPSQFTDKGELLVQSK